MNGGQRPVLGHLDAPVSGSVTAAEDGTLAIMAGGRALLLKLAINISLAAQMLAFSEGVLLAERGGVDPALARAALGGTLAIRAGHDRALLLLAAASEVTLVTAAGHRGSLGESVELGAAAS